MSHIRLLEVARYPGKVASTGVATSRECELTVLHDPSWVDIEAAIRRLDRDEYPYVWLHLTDPIVGDEPMGMNVMGGRGEYALSISQPGQVIYYRDPKRGNEVIRIWESDQGSSLPEVSLCHGLEVAVRIAKHFSETATPDPSAEWRE